MTAYYWTENSPSVVPSAMLPLVCLRDLIVESLGLKAVLKIYSINHLNYKTCDTQLLDDELIQDWTEPGLGPGSAAPLDPLTNDDTEEM